MQMRSARNTTPSEFILELLTLTVQFLDRAFHREYDNSSTYDFAQVRLSVSTYEITEDSSGGYLASIDLVGTSFFEEEAPASVTPLVVSAFSAQNQEYLNTLTMSEDAFLQGISYAVVTVNGNVAMSKAGDDISQSSFQTWSIALIAGCIAFMAVLCGCLLAMYCCFSDVPTSRARPAPGNKPVGSRDTGDSSEIEDLDGDIYSEQTRTPSPVRSITSQDSSKFTYNPSVTSRSSVDDFPRSRGSAENPSFMIHNHATDLDVESTWSKGSTIPHGSHVPFGTDISVIESKKDLSLIQEGEDEQSTPDKPLDPQYLSQENILDMERGERLQRHSLLHPGKKLLDLNGPAQDVLDELNDLSLQISSLRTHRN
jgi:hypothetical protein